MAGIDFGAELAVNQVSATEQKDAQEKRRVTLRR
jgi:hypothetical protein